MGKVHAGDVGAAQTGAEDYVDDRAVAQRPGMPVQGGGPAAVSAAGELVVGLDAVQDVFDGPYLPAGQGEDFGGGQAQQVDPLGRISLGQQPGGGVRGDPGEQRRQVGQMVVDRRRRHARYGDVAILLVTLTVGGEVVAPGAHLAGGDR
ncbi:hypothetical protein ABZU32_30155 [Sphaerisporangium sp. NPDC005288]|uniref:hypothetical protein n=1 Tax=Sphaerisporangium sp. NPDC005288 TaxID=3155114 RepID=UPI0033B6F536